MCNFCATIWKINDCFQTLVCHWQVKHTAPPQTLMIGWVRSWYVRLLKSKQNKRMLWKRYNVSLLAESDVDIKEDCHIMTFWLKTMFCKIMWQIVFQESKCIIFVLLIASLNNDHFQTHTTPQTLMIGRVRIWHVALLKSTNECCESVTMFHSWLSQLLTCSIKKDCHMMTL